MWIVVIQLSCFSSEIMLAWECSRHSKRLKINRRSSVTNALLSRRANNDVTGAFEFTWWTHYTSRWSRRIIVQLATFTIIRLVSRSCATISATICSPLRTKVFSIVIGIIAVCKQRGSWMTFHRDEKALKLSVVFARSPSTSLDR